MKSSNPTGPLIRLDFTDFWTGFNKYDNYFTYILMPYFSIDISADPDFLIYSVFGNRHQSYTCTKIFYTGENIRPNFEECDYAFSFDHVENEPRHYRLPLYAWWEDADKLLKPENLGAEEILSRKTKFCNFVYGNPAATKRLEFLRKLSRYKRVDSGGTLLNNIGRIITEKDKMSFIKEYKFTIAFENVEWPGYTTEKLVQPMLAQSLPIYWGNPLIERDFNTKSFLSYYDYGSDEELIERIVEVDRDDDLYIQYVREPYYHDNKVNRYVDPQNIVDQFRRIFLSKG